MTVNAGIVIASDSGSLCVSQNYLRACEFYVQAADIYKDQIAVSKAGIVSRLILGANVKTLERWKLLNDETVIGQIREAVDVLTFLRVEKIFFLGDVLAGTYLLEYLTREKEGSCIDGAIIYQPLVTAPRNFLKKLPDIFRITIPLLFIYGEYDNTGDKEYTLRQLAPEYKNLTVRSVKYAGLPVFPWELFFLSWKLVLKTLREWSAEKA